MNKKTERIVTIALAAFLVGMFIYQVAYGIRTEQAYNIGFSAAKVDGLNVVYDGNGGWKVTYAIGVAKFGTADGHC